MAVIYSTGNIIVNGNGEAAPGATNFSTSVPIPGWTTPGAFTTVEYTTGGPSDLNVADGLALGGGHAYFAGGPTGGTGSLAHQVVDLSAHAAAIDAGGVTADLAGQFGGFSSQNDRMTLTANFMDATGNIIGSLTIGGVTNADRLNESTLLARFGALAVPVGARSVDLVLTAIFSAGSYNDGYADNLSLALTGLSSGFVDVQATTNYIGQVIAPSAGISFESSHNSQATFRSNQFGAAHISLTAEIQGGFANDSLVISMLPGQAFSGAGFTFENWTSGKDAITFLSGAGLGIETVTGTSQNDTFRLGGGADSMTGLAGGDTYYVDNSGDLVFEQVGGGRDTVYTTANFTLAAGQEIEQLLAGPGAGALNLTGNAFANTITGGAGGDTLDGGNGLDRLKGGVGNDSFVLAKLQANRDIILDFNPVDDQLIVDASVFGAGLVAGQPLGTKFLSVAGGQAAGAEDRFIYDSATGNLYFDSNGSAAGGHALIATFVGHPVLTDADFLVIA
jgi:Ca2+-binding RTX toxin-like protein